MPYTIETSAADCKGFAVVDEGGTTVGCHKSRKEAVNHQRALYANVPDATQKEGPTVSDVHVDSAMGRVRIKKPDRIKKASVWMFVVPSACEPDTCGSGRKPLRIAATVFAPDATWPDSLEKPQSAICLSFPLFVSDYSAWYKYAI